MKVNLKDSLHGVTFDRKLPPDIMEKYIHKARFSIFAILVGSINKRRPGCDRFERQ